MSRQEKEQKEDAELKADLATLTEEHDKRKKLDEEIIELELKGDNPERLRKMREYQESLNTSIELDEKVIASLVSLVKGIVEDNYNGLEQIANGLNNLNTLQSPATQITRAKDRVSGLKRKQERISRLEDATQKLVRANTQKVEKKENN